MLSRTRRLPEPSTNEGRYSTSTGCPAANAAASAAPPCGSAVTILVAGRSALTALAIPLVRPPPPYGITIASGSGRSSRISSPIVPLPAITPGSWTGCTNRPSTPSTRLFTMTCHQSS
jgi:hypothetical protein